MSDRRHAVMKGSFGARHRNIGSHDLMTVLGAGGSISTVRRRRQFDPPSPLRVVFRIAELTSNSAWKRWKCNEVVSAKRKTTFRRDSHDAYDIDPIWLVGVSLCNITIGARHHPDEASEHSLYLHRRPCLPIDRCVRIQNQRNTQHRSARSRGDCVS